MRTTVEISKEEFNALIFEINAACVKAGEIDNFGNTGASLNSGAQFVEIYSDCHPVDALKETTETGTKYFKRVK